MVPLFYLSPNCAFVELFNDLLFLEARVNLHVVVTERTAINTQRMEEKGGVIAQIAERGGVTAKIRMSVNQLLNLRIRKIRSWKKVREKLSKSQS